MIVVDTNVLVYFFVDAPQSDDVDMVRTKDPDWRAPLLWKSEFRNALAGYIRGNVMNFEQAIDVMQKAERLMSDRESEVDSTAVMSLVSQSNCSAYDCEFVALARTLNVPLVTYDARILREFPDLSITPATFLP